MTHTNLKPKAYTLSLHLDSRTHALSARIRWCAGWSYVVCTPNPVDEIMLVLDRDETVGVTG
jgi:hypothetical protein